MTLLYDVARCHGVQIDGDWREGCEDCLRRTSPGHPTRQSYVVPPVIVVFECEYRLQPFCNPPKINHPKPVQGGSMPGHQAPSRTLIAERVDRAAILEPDNAELVSSQWP